MQTINFSISARIVFLLFVFFSAYSPVAIAQYCTSNGNGSDGYTTVTRRVVFNTIDNPSPIEDNAYSNFTSISTTVTIGNTYNLSASVNTDGNYTTRTIAWIDWNQDSDFLDAGEQYVLGAATNVANGLTSASPLAITIPLTATPGTTRMRVSTRYNTNPTSCQVGFDGEVEDYSIVISTGVPEPEIVVTGNGNNIANNAPAATTLNHTDFGGAPVGNTITRTFTIVNTGTLNLTVGMPTITGLGAGEFTITSAPATNVAAGSSTNLIIDFIPTALVTSDATVTFINDDADENPYSFAIKGKGIDPTAVVAIYCEDFEGGAAGWTNTTSTNGAWSQGTETTASTGAIGTSFFTGRTSSEYQNDYRQVVTSPVIDMTGFEKINFSIDLWYDMTNDGNTTTATPDGFQIQYSDDAGTTWYALGNAVGDGTNWYNSSVIYNFGITSDGTPSYIHGWTNTSSGWVTANIELESQAVDNNANVQFRIDFR